VVTALPRLLDFGKDVLIDLVVFVLIERLKVRPSLLLRNVFFFHLAGCNNEPEQVRPFASFNVVDRGPLEWLPGTLLFLFELAQHLERNSPRVRLEIIGADIDALFFRQRLRQNRRAGGEATIEFGHLPGRVYGRRVRK
jgi:hypothetical protein